MSIMRQV